VTETPVVTVIGEALVDLIPDGATGEYRPTPGGSPFNVAVGLVRLGNRTALMARFADDRHGRMLRSAAAAEGIDLRGAPRASQRASVAIASVDDAARATYEFDLEGTADWQWTAAELRELSPDTQVLHFGSIASWTPPGDQRIADLVAELRAGSDVLISYDPNIRPAAIEGRERGVDLVERGVRDAHVSKASREDVEWLYPGLAVDDVAARWNGLGAKLVVVTAGADGATGYRSARPPLRRPGRQVTVVDTIGAGDAFTSGLLTGLVRRGLHRDRRLEGPSDGTLADIVDEAALIAAITCERVGADPPRLEELTDRLREDGVSRRGADAAAAKSPRRRTARRSRR
jgi:fructokinase